MRLRLCILLSACLVFSTSASATNLTNIDGVKPSQDGRVDIYGTLDLEGSRITGLSEPTSDADAAPKSWINENDDTIPDTVVPDNQALSTNSDVSGTDDQISIDNGNSITIDDDFSPDTVVPDDQNIQVSSSGDTITVSIDNGNGGSASIQDNVADGDTDDTNELQTLEQTRSRNNNLNGNIDFQSSGSIVSLENLNVDSINSNKGNDPVDLDQGIDLDGSTIVDDNDNTVNIADSLNVANKLNINGKIRVNAIEDRGTGNTITAGSNINLDGNKITNLASPDNPSDAATKNYVDEATSSSGSISGIKRTWIEQFDTGDYNIENKDSGVTVNSTGIHFDPYGSRKQKHKTTAGATSSYDYRTFQTLQVSKSATGETRFTAKAVPDRLAGCHTYTRVYDATNNQQIVRASEEDDAFDSNVDTQTEDYSFSQSSITVRYQFYKTDSDCNGGYAQAWYRQPKESTSLTVDPQFSPEINQWGTITYYDLYEPSTSDIKVDVIHNGNAVAQDVQPRTDFSGVPNTASPKIQVRGSRDSTEQIPRIGLLALTGYL